MSYRCDCGATEGLEKKRNACPQCAHKRKLALADKRRQAVLSGAVKWQCSKCGASDVKLYRPRDDAKLCINCHNARNRQSYHGADTPESSVKVLDADALAAVQPVPGNPLRLIDKLNRERQALYLENTGREMPDVAAKRCAEISAALPRLWAMERKSRAGERMGRNG